MSAQIVQGYHICVLHQIAHEALSTSGVSQQYVLFSAGNVASSCYYLTFGELDYAQADESTSVGCGVWMSEAVLWTQWTHLGHLTAQKHSEMLLLGAETFCRLVLSHSEYRVLAKRYAQRFVNALNRQALTAISDMPLMQQIYVSYAEIGYQPSESRPSPSHSWRSTLCKYPLSRS